MSWFQTNRDLLEELFRSLGKEHDWSDDPEALVEHALPRWLGTEHGNVGEKEAFDSDEVAAARPIIDDLGFTERVGPRRERYDEIVVLGAAAIGLHRRLELVRESGVRAPVLTVLAGMRPHLGPSGHGRDGAMGELLAVNGRFAAVSGWRPPAVIAHQAKLLAAAGVDEQVAAQVLWPSETDLARFLLRKQWPSLRLTNVIPSDHPHADENPELGQRGTVMEEYAGAEQMPLVRLINGRPVQRAHGPPRPTSASTLREWQEISDPREDRYVLFVVNQPHLSRVALELENEFGLASDSPLRFDVAGSATLTDISIYTLLGEVAARLARDVR